MKSKISFDNLTDVSPTGTHFAVAYVDGKRVCATMDNHTVYVDDKPIAYFYHCSPKQLRELFIKVVQQLEQQSTNS